MDNQQCIRDDSEAVEKPKDRKERKNRAVHESDDIPSEITYDNTTFIADESA